MKIIKMALVLSILFLITGCSTAMNSSNDATKVETSSNGSYVAVLFVNGEVLHTVGERLMNWNLSLGNSLVQSKKKLILKNDLLLNLLQII